MYEYYQATHCPNGFSEIKKLLEDLHMNKKTPTLPGVENMLRRLSMPVINLIMFLLNITKN